MKKTLLSLALAASLLGLAACNGGASTSTASGTDSTATVATTATPESTIMDFAKWYGENEMALAKIEVIHQKEGELYKVVPAGLDSYLDKLKSSGFFSNVYLDQERQEILKLDETFAAEQQMDGPPTGWDYDRVLLSQDTEPILDELSKAENLKSSGSGNTVVVTAGKTMPLQFTMSKDGAGWKIDKIQSN